MELKREEKYRMGKTKPVGGHTQGTYGWTERKLNVVKAKSNNRQEKYRKGKTKIAGNHT